MEDEFTKDEQRATRDEDGNTYYVPADMTYKNWKKNIDNGTNLAENKNK